MLHHYCFSFTHQKIMFLLQCYGNSGNSCCFSVGSCYNINSGFASFGNSFWKHLWQNIHERLKRFLWRLAAIIIPTKDVLVKRLEELDQMCNLCDRETKTLFHLFKECLGGRLLAFSSKWDLNLKNWMFLTFRSWFEVAWIWFYSRICRVIIRSFSLFFGDYTL